MKRYIIFVLMVFLITNAYPVNGLFLNANIIDDIGAQAKVLRTDSENIIKIVPEI